MNERSHICSCGTWSVDQLIQLAQQRGLSHDLNIRQGLAQAHTRAETLRYMGFRMRTAMSQMRMPGPEALTLKLAYANHWILTAELATEILGAGAMLWADDAHEDNQWVSTYSANLPFELVVAPTKFNTTSLPSADSACRANLSLTRTCRGVCQTKLDERESKRESI